MTTPEPSVVHKVFERLTRTTILLEDAELKGVDLMDLVIRDADEWTVVARYRAVKRAERMKRAEATVHVVPGPVGHGDKATEK